MVFFLDFVLRNKATYLVCVLGVIFLIVILKSFLGNSSDTGVVLEGSDNNDGSASSSTKVRIWLIVAVIVLLPLGIAYTVKAAESMSKRNKDHQAYKDMHERESHEVAGYSLNRLAIELGIIKPGQETEIKPLKKAKDFFVGAFESNRDDAVTTTKYMERETQEEDPAEVGR